MERLERESWRLDVASALGWRTEAEVAVDVVFPAEMERPPVLLFCLPGGYLSRRYFDPGDPEDPTERSFSFADYMARRGFVVAMADTLGCGDSTRPSESAGYQVDVDKLTTANHAAWLEVVARIGARTRQGVLSVGVGHSMGSALTVALQANHRPFAALVLQSFSTTGLPRFLQGDEERYADDPAAARSALAELVRRRFGTPYPGQAKEGEPGQSAAFSVGTAPPLAEALLQRSATNLVAMAGLLTMIPGGYVPYAEAVEVPVFVNYGDHDLGRANNAAPTLPNAPEVLAYTLADSWHCHNVANTRVVLWERTLRWLQAVLPTLTPSPDR